ncbi:MAG TPA: sigma-70 family RNA polymerase sigma factor [Solirubrobacteraceae bacterium]
MTSHEESEDARLLAAAAAGDDAAFGTLYGRYLPVVVRWCLHETANREVAADLAAEVFAAVLISARRYRPDQGPVVAWLLGIARNKLRESRRHKRVEDRARRRLGLDPVPISDEDVERVEELASLDGEILARVAELPVEQRDALVSRIVEERPYEEIAAELRCSESVVRKRVSRGLKTLKSQMEER